MYLSKSADKYCHKQCCGSGSAWICTNFDRLDLDQDPESILQIKCRIRIRIETNADPQTGHKTYECNNYVSVYTNSAKIFKSKNCYLNWEETSVDFTKCSMWKLSALATMLPSFTETDAGGGEGGGACLFLSASKIREAMMYGKTWDGICLLKQN